ncbi:MAG: SRPBCC family protein [Elusimicrobia bacterium]|nr:SRPBCC family protein [Elusimicrobiota bacterium]
MLTISRRLLVSAPAGVVRRYLGDLREIARYDPKVDAVELAAADEEPARAVLSGRFLGLPWRGVFRFEFGSDGGYRGAMLEGPLRRMEFRLSLRPVSGGTMLEHSESYKLSALLGPFQPFLRRRIAFLLETKLDAVKEGAEALNRRLHLQSLEA